MHFKDRNREEWDFFFFPVGFSSLTAGGGKAAFSQILPSFTIHVLSECCKHPLARGLINKIQIIWQEMESCPGVQQRDPFDFPFNFLSVFPWTHLTFSSISHLKLCLLFVVVGPSARGAGIVFVLDAPGGLTNPRAADFTAQTTPGFVCRRKVALR